MRHWRKRYSPGFGASCRRPEAQSGPSNPRRRQLAPSVVDPEAYIDRAAGSGPVAPGGGGRREQLEREKSVIRKNGRKRCELEKLRDELEKKGPLMTADARREKQEGFERKRRDAARMRR